MWHSCFIYLQNQLKYEPIKGVHLAWAYEFFSPFYYSLSRVHKKNVSPYSLMLLFFSPTKQMKYIDISFKQTRQTACSQCLLHSSSSSLNNNNHQIPTPFTHNICLHSEQHTNTSLNYSFRPFFYLKQASKPQ